MSFSILLFATFAFFVDFQSGYDPRDLSLEYLLMERLAIRGVLDRNGLSTRPIPERSWNEKLRLAVPRTEFDSAALRALSKATDFEKFALKMPIRLHGYLAVRDTVHRHEIYSHLYGTAMLRLRTVSLFHKSAIFNRRMSNWHDLPFYDPLVDPDFRLVCFEDKPVVGERETFEVRTDRAYIHIELPFGDLEVGRDEPRFGPGFRSAVAFSGYSQPMEYIYNLRVRNRWLTFVTFNAFASDTIKWKRVSAQRLELNFWRLTVGFTESVVYNSSDPFKYFNPLGLYYITQRRGESNTDNLMGGMDISLFVGQKLKVYGELLDDDIIITRSHPSPSKYGLMLGFHAVDPFGLRNSDLIFEFTHVARFTYAHVYSDYANTPEIVGYPFVFWGGPNVDCISLDIFKFWGPENGIRLGFEFLRHGDDGMHSGYQSDIDIPPNRPNFDRIFTVRTVFFGDFKGVKAELGAEISRLTGELRDGWRFAFRFDIVPMAPTVSFDKLLPHLQGGKVTSTP